MAGKPTAPSSQTGTMWKPGEQPGGSSRQLRRAGREKRSPRARLPTRLNFSRNEALGILDSSPLNLSAQVRAGRLRGAQLALVNSHFKVELLP